MYATKATFDGQRASVGRVVVIRVEKDERLEAAVVAQAWSNADGEEWLTITSALTGIDHEDLKFVATKTEDEINALPAGSWTWPVRV